MYAIHFPRPDDITYPNGAPVYHTRAWKGAEMIQIAADGFAPYRTETATPQIAKDIHTLEANTPLFPLHSLLYTDESADEKSYHPVSVDAQFNPEWIIALFILPDRAFFFAIDGDGESDPMRYGRVPIIDTPFIRSDTMVSLDLEAMPNMRAVFDLSTYRPADTLLLAPAQCNHEYNPDAKQPFVFTLAPSFYLDGDHGIDFLVAPVCRVLSMTSTDEYQVDTSRIVAPNTENLALFNAVHTLGDDIGMRFPQLRRMAIGCPYNSVFEEDTELQCAYPSVYAPIEDGLPVHFKAYLCAQRACLVVDPNVFERYMEFGIDTENELSMLCVHSHTGMSLSRIAPVPDDDPRLHVTFCHWVARAWGLEY